MEASSVVRLCMTCAVQHHCTAMLQVPRVIVLFAQAKGVVADALLLMMKSGCLATDNQSVSSLATSQYLNTVSAVGSGLFLQMMPPQQFVQALCAKVPAHYTFLPHSSHHCNPPPHLSPSHSTCTLITLPYTLFFTLSPLFPLTPLLPLSLPLHQPLPAPSPSHPPLPLPTQPSILPAHIHHVREMIPQCGVAQLVQLAKLLDPSQSTVRPLLFKAMTHPRPRSVEGRP